MKNQNGDPINSSYICVVNAYIRHSRQLSSYAKLVCIELLALSDANVIRESDEDIATLLDYPVTLIEEALDLLEHYNFISITYPESGREIKLEEVCL